MQRMLFSAEPIVLIPCPGLSVRTSIIFYQDGGTGFTDDEQEQRVATVVGEEWRRSSDFQK